jgi:hypothetical protein
MMRFLSKPRPTFDTSASAFRGAAGDLGEVIALLAGGVKPCPETVSRLCLSLRLLQGFLISEAEQQAQREAIVAAIDPAVWAAPQVLAVSQMAEVS